VAPHAPVNAPGANDGRVDERVLDGNDVQAALCGVDKSVDDVLDDVVLEHDAEHLQVLGSDEVILCSRDAVLATCDDLEGCDEAFLAFHAADRGDVTGKFHAVLDQIHGAGHDAAVGAEALGDDFFGQRLSVL